MTNRQKILWLLLVLALGWGCKRSAAEYPLSNLRAISSFNLEFYHNSQANIHVTHEGEINETDRMIYVSVPADADLSCLRPTIELSPWTTCEPKSLQTVDFSNGDSLDYTVTAQSGKIAVYTVYIKKDYKYTQAELLYAYTPDLLDGNGEPRKALFATPRNGEKGVLSLPEGTEVSALRLHLDISNASYHSTIEICTHSDKSIFVPYVDYGTYDLSENVAFIRITPEEGKALTYEMDIVYFTDLEDSL